MMAQYGATLILLASLVRSQAIADQTRCPSLAANPSCHCFNFENGIFLECPAATVDSLKSVLEIILGPIQSLSIYDPDKTLVRVPKDFFPEQTVIKHLQISQSNIQELHDDCLQQLKPQLESFSLVSGRLREIPQKAFKGLNKLIALDLEANEINDLPSYSFYGLHLIKLNMKGNQVQKVGRLLIINILINTINFFILVKFIIQIINYVHVILKNIFCFLIISFFN